MSFNPTQQGTIDWGQFPLNLFQQMFQGNTVAWLAFGLGISIVGLIMAVMIVWWKLPGYAKTGVKNETFGAHNPHVATTFETKKVVFHTPQMLPHGFMYDERIGVFIPMKRWATEATGLDGESIELMTDVYTIDGSNSPFYNNYSVQGVVVNPKFAAVITHFDRLQQLQKASANQPVLVSKKLLIEALQRIDGDTVNFGKFYFSIPSDIRGLKTLVTKALSKSNFKEYENWARMDERKKQNLGSNHLIIGLLIISVAVGIIGVALHFFH